MDESHITHTWAYLPACNNYFPSLLSRFTLIYRLFRGKSYEQWIYYFYLNERTLNVSSFCVNINRMLSTNSFFLLILQNLQINFFTDVLCKVGQLVSCPFASGSSYPFVWLACSLGQVVFHMWFCLWHMSV